MPEVFAPSSLCVCSQMPWRSLQIIVPVQGFFAWAHKIWRIVKISDLVDWFLRKTFWFFQRIFSISGFMRLSSGALYIWAVMEERVILRQFLAIPRSPFLGKGRMHPFFHLSIVFWLYTALQYQSSLSSNFLVFHTSGVFHEDLQLSCF